jgi:hypothetical protein
MWSKSRALLRPQFYKQRVSDLQVFENHISKMLSLLPKDGRTINLMDWWFRFTLDASTEYLLGQSVDSLGDATVFCGASQLIFIELVRQSVFHSPENPRTTIPNGAILETISPF